MHGRPVPFESAVPTRAVLFVALLAWLAGAGQAAPTGGVRGQVTDTRGRPLAGVRLWIKPAFTTGLGEAVTDAQGRYALDGLPPVGYRAYAWLEVPFGGSRLCYRLVPTAPNAFVPGPDAVQNFRWSLTGRTPEVEDREDWATLGGTLALIPSMTSAMNDEGRALRPGERLEVRLTPAGRRVDGSEGAAIQRTTGDTSRVYDLPIGPYRVRATAVDDNGSRAPVRLSTRDRGFADEAAVTFEGPGVCVGRMSGPAGHATLYYTIR